MTKNLTTVPYKIYLPATADQEAIFVKTIEIEVYYKNEQEFVTVESRKLIEEATAQAMGLLNGTEIKALRKRLKITQEKLSELIGCGKKTLSRWENGRGLPTNTYNKFLRLLDEGIVTPEQLKNIQSPRQSEKEKSFFAERPENIYHHDFKTSKPPKEAVQKLMEQEAELGIMN